jgi:hypothetical protein
MVMVGGRNGEDPRFCFLPGTLVGKAVFPTEHDKVSHSMMAFEGLSAWPLSSCFSLLGQQPVRSHDPFGPCCMMYFA